MAAKIDDINPDGLKTLAGAIRDRGDNLVVILGAPQAEGKVSVVCAVSAPLTKRGFHAGKLVNDVAAVVDGRGGGRPDLAQAGGKDATKLGEALNLGRNKVAELAKEATAQKA